MLSSLKGKEKAAIQKKLLHRYSNVKIEDTEVLGRQRAKPSKIEARYSQPTWCIIIMVHNTVAQ